jgi:uracil phosphoribosyltransferase
MKNYMENVVVIDHPLVQHKLTLMRDKNTGTKDFRMLLNELSTLMAYEVTRDLPMEEVDIETPVASMRARVLAGRKLGIVPILRAGLGMAEGVMELIPPQKSDISGFIATLRRSSLSAITASCPVTPPSAI